jgi:alkylated DNA repair protein (DNA oxidative demethylase)
VVATRDLRGVTIWPGWLDRTAQRRLLAEVLAVMEEAPPLRHATRAGPMSVAMTSAGSWGWVASARGYGYAPRHPGTGRPWPPIPPGALALWAAVVPWARAPDSCLVNLYREGARMGMHQDRDEADLLQPVVSISLGDEALFRVGGTVRGGSTASAWLASGDVAVIGGPARLAFHGIDRLRPGSSDLIPGGGRINLTLRVAR